MQWRQYGDDNFESQVGFSADDCSVVATHTNISTYFSLLRRAIRALLLGAGASFAAAASLPTSCITLQLSAPVVRNIVPEGCGFLGS